MREENFAHAVNQIAAFLGSREAPAHTKVAWFEKVQNIPEEALPFIVEKLTDECDTMPRNLPKAFREKFRAWQMENPGKVASVDEKGCRDCEAGILFLERDGRTAVIFCHCLQGSAGYVGRVSLAQMEAQGWRSTKGKTLGADFKNAPGVRDQVARARAQYARPDNDRRGYYGEAEEDAAW
jgi:hypothetical protein